ncbi:hypothetical protein SLEP1_g12887 [Rubroshorea leprosula]|uniref:Uncharacterized protein n=1 Tax=Rubroshorea leprosula TaxID=152421 RepID=A0AAV5IIG8_9ROSI|nr:hypothetical protein SLEP1_g12887 [Rubroshorea leprosula]
MKLHLRKDEVASQKGRSCVSENHILDEVASQEEEGMKLHLRKDEVASQKITS